LQVSLLAHLATDVLAGRWPVQLFWPLSASRWHLGLVAKDDPILGLVLYAAALTALCSHTLAFASAVAGVGRLAVYLARRASRPRLNPQPERGPCIWQGCDLSAWLRLLASNRFAVHPSRWSMAAGVTLASLVNSSLRLLRCICCGPRRSQASLPEAPIFI